MSAYAIVDTKISDPDGYERYKALARPLVEAHGGRYLARGGTLHVDDDDLWAPTRIVLLEFPDLETARRFFDSEDYAPVKALRREFAESTVVVVDGEA
jgi:uncharacterized protein (DUF1330 family)